MFLARRSAAPMRQLLRHNQPRRFESSSAHASQPVNESFGRGFYIAVASVPLGFALYKFAVGDGTSKPWLTRLIEQYEESGSKLERDNALHTAAAEQAAHDRHLFHGQNPPLTIDLMFPEAFNAGSPINVSPGSQADLSKVVTHYEERNRAREEKRVARMKDGKVVSMYEDGRYI
ncbi:hypothetical protein FQN54_003291 [Arachnomyces sp. PD_36]|nr:hypothetical protein FQN54_003291 [Arachnomyces sp. PD_36]